MMAGAACGSSQSRSAVERIEYAMFKPEELANWYLRLNGFLTIPNFVLHPDSPGSQRTDADVLGLRFPFRKEFPGVEADHSSLRFSTSKPSLYFAEVKSNQIDLNESWKNPNKENINKALLAIGLFQSEKDVQEASEALYERGSCESQLYYCSLLFIGDVDVGRIPQQYNDVPRIFWDDTISFVHSRFRQFVRIKSDNQQWGDAGKKLYSLAASYSDFPTYKAKVRSVFGLPLPNK